jgi:hypothetical protein
MARLLLKNISRKAPAMLLQNGIFGKTFLQWNIEGTLIYIVIKALVKPIKK